MCFCLVVGRWRSSDFLRSMWYKFASQKIPATFTKTTLAKIHVIISFWGSEDLDFIGWIVSLNGCIML